MDKFILCLSAFYLIATFGIDIPLRMDIDICQLYK